MPVCRGAAVALALGLLGPAAAIAGPPYVTDDPEPTDLGKWENYAFVAGTGFGRAVDGTAGFDLNYGAAKDLQASAVVGLAYAGGDGDRFHAGIADTEIGLKYRFVHQAAGRLQPDIGVFPKLGLPTAGRRFGSGRIGVQLPLWAQKDFGPWSAFGGGGYQINPGAGNRDFAFAGLAVTRQITRRVSLGAEAYHQSADTVDSRAVTGVGVGASYGFARHWSLIGSGGPLIGRGDAARRYAFYLAFAFHD